MQVAVKGQLDTYSPCLLHEEHAGKSTVKADQQETIESLLPDEEDLFSGVIDELGCTATVNGDDEDLDLFSSSGGMELEGNSKLHLRQQNSVTAKGLNYDQSSSDYLVGCEYPSRTLFVKNVDKSVEDSELRVLFEQYGDIQTFYTTCRSRGFVIISYYDIRAATSALSTLQNKPLQNGKLHIHYSNLKADPSGQYIDQASLEVFNCDSSISDDKLRQIFCSFGDIEEICGSTHRRHIKYYDIRAAEAALNGLNNSNMLQEHIKFEVAYPERAKSLTQQLTHGLVQGQLRSCQNPNGNSLPEVVNSCLKDGYIYGVRSLSEKSTNAPTHTDYCFTNSLLSPVGMTSIYNQFGLHGPHYSIDQAKLLNGPSFHSQSFPVNCEGFVDNGVITYDSLNLTSVGFTTETNGKHLHTLGTYDAPMEPCFRGSSRTGSLPLTGHHHVWSGPNSFQNHHLNPFNNGVCVHNTSNIPVLLEVLPPVLYAVSPTHKQHVISYDDLQRAYTGESSKAANHLNPLRVVGFPSKVASHDLTQVTGNRVDAFPDSIIYSPQIISHKSPEREAETSSPVSFCKPRGRGRRISHGRHETVSCHTDEKKYELDIERVLHGEDSRTTLMIKNIPNKYNSEMLLAAINEHNQGTYDFIYLPLDFKNKCNMGYAFINMIDPLQIVCFYKSINGKKWEKFHSGKVACLAYARIQGKAALIAHFQESSLMNEDKCCHPILFTTDGPNAGNQEPFPLGTSIQSRRHKNRCNFSEANQNQEISSYHIKNSV